MIIFICPSDMMDTTNPARGGRGGIATDELPGVYQQVFERYGEVRAIDSVDNIPGLVQSCQAQGKSCVYLAYCLPHELPENMPCPVVPVFGWQYSSLPNEPWGGNPNHDWRRPLAASAGAITFSSHSARLVREAMGEAFDLATAPLPIWDEFAQLADGSGPRDPVRRQSICCGQMPIDSARIDFSLEQGVFLRNVLEADDPEGLVVGLEGIVYTAVFDTSDELANWQDFLSAFCWAFRARTDVTLVMVLTDAQVLPAYAAVLKSLYDLEPLECRVVTLCESLPEDQYRQLICATSYIVTSTSAEAQCLPLMEFMSAGVPAIAPDHTALSDYVDEKSAFVVESSLEWVPWPHDPRMVRRTFRSRINWASLLGAFEDSLRLATENPQGYAAMSVCAEGKQRNFCSVVAVQAALLDFFAADRFPVVSATAEESSANNLLTGILRGILHRVKKFVGAIK